MKPIVNGLASLADSTLLDMKQGEPPLTLDFPEMVVQLGKEGVGELDGQKYNNRMGKIRLPHFKSTKDAGAKSACIERRVRYKGLA